MRLVVGVKPEEGFHLAPGNRATIWNDWPGASVSGMSPSSVKGDPPPAAADTNRNIGVAAAAGLKFGRLRQHVRVVTTTNAAIDPLRDQLDLLLRQARVVTELTESLDAAPRRHSPRQHRLFDLIGSWLRVRICHQRERRPIRPMTRSRICRTRRARSHDSR